jgi:hypothetical protein
LNINELDEEAMFIESVQFPNPVGESDMLFFQIWWILVHLFLMKLPVKTRLIEDDLTVTAVIIGSHDLGDYF